MRRACLFLVIGLLASLLGCAGGSDDGQGRVTLPTQPGSTLKNASQFHTIPCKNIAPEEGLIFYFSASVLRKREAEPRNK